MSVNSKRVFYVKYLAHPVYAEMLAARPDVRLDRLENETAEAVFAPVLTPAGASIPTANSPSARYALGGKPRTP